MIVCAASISCITPDGYDVIVWALCAVLSVTFRLSYSLAVALSFARSHAHLPFGLPLSRSRGTMPDTSPLIHGGDASAFAFFYFKLLFNVHSLRFTCARRVCCLFLVLFFSAHGFNTFGR